MTAAQDLFRFRTALTRLFADDEPVPWSPEKLLEHVRFAILTRVLNDPDDAFDASLGAIRELVKQTGCLRAQVHVMADGRIEFEGIDVHGCQKWRVRGDLDPDSSDPTPSAALLSRFPRKS